MSDLIHQPILDRAHATPDATALEAGERSLDYAGLAGAVEAAARGYLGLGLAPADRVAVYLPKQLETVVAMFGATLAGGAFVPVNPVLKPRQVTYILRDCNVRVLVTSGSRADQLRPHLEQCPDLRHVVLVDPSPAADGEKSAGYHTHPWATLADPERKTVPCHPRLDVDMAAILYTSGSTGQPKGVVLSHRNLAVGAASVAGYLGNHPGDRILSALPLSFDAGLSQLTTAFVAGARVVLLEYLLPRDVIRSVARHRITGLTAVPPIWIPLARLPWPEEAVASLRYLANTGGAMPTSVTAALRAILPRTEIFLMYGLTEAFRSTYLPPSEVERRPDSIGRAIPNAEILVVREDGSRCSAGEPGELVHRGALVAQGYWNDPERTAERFRPAPGQPAGLPIPEIAVWSGDTVRMDDAGYLYFVGRKDDMIKVSGYRVSSTEIEEVIYAGGTVQEAAVVGVPHPVLGQAVVAVVTPAGPGFDPDALMGTCKRELPGFMVPNRIVERTALPRNPNGKIDRKALASELRDLFAETANA